MENFMWGEESNSTLTQKLNECMYESRVRGDSENLGTYQ